MVVQEGGLKTLLPKENQGDDPLIVASNVKKSFGGVHALTDASLTLRAGEIHGVIGENGSGKSTLLHIIAGLHQPEGGSFALRGNPVSLREVQRRFREEVSLVSQELSLANDLTVGENIVLRPNKPGWSLKINWKQLHREAREVLDALGIDVDTHRKVGALPLAQRQLIEIARVIAQQSPVMILDEPTSALSDQEVEPLFRVVEQLAHRGTSIVIVTHRMEELLRVSDRLTVLRDGQTVASAPRSEFDRASLVRAMLGHDPDEYVAPASSGATHPVLLTLRTPTPVGESSAIDKVEVREGEVLGIFGLADAGCEVLLQHITGSRPASENDMEFEGRSYYPRKPIEALRRGIGYVPADRGTDGLVPMMSVHDNIHLGSPTVRARLRTVQRQREATRVQEFIKSFRIRLSTPKVSVRSLSGGNQQKVLLAKALTNQPRLLALEEPTRGVDIGAKDEIHRILHQLRDDGMSLIVISTDIEEMLVLCDRFYVMRDGVVTGELSRSEATQARLTHLATLAPSTHSTESPVS